MKGERCQSRVLSCQVDEYFSVFGAVCIGRAKRQCISEAAVSRGTKKTQMNCPHLRCSILYCLTNGGSSLLL